MGDGAFRKKSGAKMMEILSGGTTGVLVSHSIGQVRELCNKILWLDHGNQIAFSEDVQLYCDAYEEFLATKTLPKTSDDVYALAESFSKRTERERAQRRKKEAQRLEKILEKGTSESAILAAIKILQKSRPEALAPEYNGGNTEK